MDSEPLVLQAFGYQEVRKKRLVQQNQQMQRQLETRDNELRVLRAELQNSEIQLEQANAKISALGVQLANSQDLAKNIQLNEKAERTHLRDSADSVKARAYNLLSDSVLECFKLSLSALQRENPKTAAAIYQIELALERVEKEMSCFK